MNTVTRTDGYVALIKEFIGYLNERKSFWLAPLIFALLLLSALAFFLEGTVLAPAIYAIF